MALGFLITTSITIPRCNQLHIHWVQVVLFPGVKMLLRKHEGNRHITRPRRRMGKSKSILKNEGVDWIHLAQNRDQRRDIEDTVTNFRFHKRREFLEKMGDH
jgi:hypothetical protein